MSGVTDAKVAAVLPAAVAGQNAEERQVGSHAGASSVPALQHLTCVVHDLHLGSVGCDMHYPAMASPLPGEQSLAAAKR